MNRIYFLGMLLIAFVAGTFMGIAIGTEDGPANSPFRSTSFTSNNPSMVVTPASLAPAVGVDRPLDFADLADAAMPAVVGITNTHRGSDQESESLREGLLPRWFFGNPQREQPDRRFHPPVDELPTAGTGFFVTEDGYILTNNHVVQNSDRLLVALQDGTEYEATVIGTDPSIDLALIKIEAEDGEKFPTLPLGSSESLRVGEWVMTIGNPLGFTQSVTVGIVSAKDRKINLPGTDGGVAEFIQTDAAINRGNSGGPLLDTRGRVVGINTAINRANMAEGIGFAVQIDEASKAMKQLLETGEVKRGLIGISMNPQGIDREARRYLRLPDSNGVLVERVTLDGPADKAGVRRGDVIREIDGKIVRSNDALLSEISSRRPGEKVKLLIFRNAKTFETTARLGERTPESLLARNTRQQGGRDDDEESEQGEATGLGMTVETFDPHALMSRMRLRVEENLRGVVVSEVEFGSQAEDKGVQPGNVIVSINDQPVSDIGDWKSQLDKVDKGDTVKLDMADLNGTTIGFVFLTVKD